MTGQGSQTWTELASQYDKDYTVFLLLEPTTTGKIQVLDDWWRVWITEAHNVYHGMDSAGTSTGVYTQEGGVLLVLLD